MSNVKFNAFLMAMVTLLLGFYFQSLAQNQTAPRTLPDGYVPRQQPTARGLAPGLKVQVLGATGRVWKVTMATNDEVMSGMAEFAEKHKIASAYVTGVGGFVSATFGWTDPQVRAFKKIEVKDKVEVSSFTGNISTENGQVQVHFHAIVTGSDGIARGGHLIEAQVNPTMELYVVEAPPGALPSSPR